jgi:lysophospholipase L1-like esterase
MMRRAQLLLLMLVATLALSAPAAAATKYVSLGDSATAGPLIPNQIRPYGCYKSDHNYPHLTAGARGLALVDPSCSGAKTSHMTSSQSLDFDGPNPPQFDSLTPDTNMVTLQIGGNDIGFSSISQGCVSALPWGSPCKNKYVHDGRDELSERIQATAPLVDAVLDGIRARSPDARVFVVNYAAILPDSGSGCWPRLPYASGDVGYLRDKHKQLNAMLAVQAAANGAGLIDWYTASIGRDACKGSDVRWVEPWIPTNPAAPLHPNLRGMRGAAGLLSAAL